MNDTNIYKEMPNFILTQAPVLLVGLGGLIVALRFRRKAPSASLWAAGAFALAVFTSALAGIAQAVGSDATTHSYWSRAAGGHLCASGLLASMPGEPAHPQRSTGAPESVWQHVRSTIRARPGLLAIFFTLFISIFLVVVVTTTLVTFMLPESFVSKARMRCGPMRRTPPRQRAARPHPAVLIRALFRRNARSSNRRPFSAESLMTWI